MSRTQSGSQSALISAKELNEIKGTVKIIDASWYMPFVNREPKDEFLRARIPNSSFFDIDAVCDVEEKALPHMLPKEKAFALACDSVNVSARDDVVVYDRAENGVFSCCRLWWMFKAFGHRGTVRVLDGGFEAWKREGFDVDMNVCGEEEVLKSKSACARAYESTDDRLVAKYEAKLNLNRLAMIESVRRDVCEENKKQCVDARPAGRFLGTTAEPRPGLACGSIPNSKNVPFPEVLDAAGKFKTKEALLEIFQQAGMELNDKEKKIVATCGTGVTACILTLAMHECGRDDVEVYDGSWCEWGSRSDVPVKTSSS